MRRSPMTIKTISSASTWPLIRSFSNVCGVAYMTRFVFHYPTSWLYAHIVKKQTTYCINTSVFGYVTCEFNGRATWYATRFVTGVDLLSDEWFRWSNEYDLALWKPIVDCQCFISDTQILYCRTPHSQLSITTPAMKVFPNPVGRATRVFSSRQLLTMLYW